MPKPPLPGMDLRPFLPVPEELSEASVTWLSGWQHPVGPMPSASFPGLLTLFGSGRSSERVRILHHITAAFLHTGDLQST